MSGVAVGSRPYWLIVLLCLFCGCSACHADDASNLARAQELFTAKDWAGAIPVLLPLSTSSDKTIAPKALRMLGTCYQNTKTFPKALQAFQKLLADFPQAAAPEIEVKLLVLDCLLAIKPEDGTAYMETLLKDYPNDAAAIHCAAGKRYRLREEFDKAISELDESARLKTASDSAPPASEIQGLMLDCYIAKGDQTKADALKEQVLKQYPEAACLIHYSLGRRYLMKRDFPRAVRAFALAAKARKPTETRVDERDLQEKLLDCYTALALKEKREALLAQMLKQYPDYAFRLHFIVGVRHHMQKQWAPAAEELGKAWDLKDKAARGIDIKDMSHRLLESYFLCGDKEKGNVLLAELIREYPKDEVDLYLIAGQGCQRSNRFVDAITLFRKAADVAPSTAQAGIAIQILDCYLGKNDEATAQKLLDEITKAYPQRAAGLHRAMGNRYELQRKLPQAIAEYKKSLELTTDPKDSVAKWAHEHLAVCYHSIGAVAEAAKHMEFLIENCPADREGWEFTLACLYAELGPYEKAIPVLRRVMERYPKTLARAQIVLVEALRGLGRADEGLSEIKKYYEGKPELREQYLRTYSKALFMARKYPEAAVFLELFIKECPEDPEVPAMRTKLASALEAAGRTDEAVAELRARASDATTAGEKALFLDRVGNACYNAKRYRDAIRAFKEVRELRDAPDEMKAEAAYRSGLCYQAIGHHASARLCMEQAVGRYPQSQWARKARAALYVWANYGEKDGLRP